MSEAVATQASLDQLHEKVDTQHRDNESDHRDLAESAERANRILTGHNGTPGVLERLRSIESLAVTLKKAIWLGGVAVAGLFGTLIWNVIVYYLENQTP